MDGEAVEEAVEVGAVPDPVGGAGEEEAAEEGGDHADADADVVIEAGGRDDDAPGRTADPGEGEGPERAVGAAVGAPGDPGERAEDDPGEEEEGEEDRVEGHEGRVGGLVRRCVGWRAMMGRSSRRSNSE